MHEDKFASKNKKITGKKFYKPICFNYHKVGHTANVCRSRSNAVNGYRPNTYDGYMPSTFNGYCYNCNKYGHRPVECRSGMNN